MSQTARDDVAFPSCWSSCALALSACGGSGLELKIRELFLMRHSDPGQTCQHCAYFHASHEPREQLPLASFVSKACSMTKSNCCAQDLELAKSKHHDSIHLLEPSQASQAKCVFNTNDADGMRAPRRVLVDGHRDAKVRAPGVIGPRVATHGFVLLSLFPV